MFDKSGRAYDLLAKFNGKLLTFGGRHYGRE